MLDFFVALFGGLGYTAKSSYNKFQTQSVKSRNRKYEITDATVRRHDTPKTLADGWVMLNEIEDELVDIFGNDWVWLFKRSYGYSNPKKVVGREFDGTWGVWAIAYNIWLSKQGCISDVEYQIVSPKHFGEIYLTPEERWKYPHLAGKANGHRIILKMFKTIEYNMQTRFPDQNFGLWLHHTTQFYDKSPWTIKWNYWFESIGCAPTTKPW